MDESKPAAGGVVWTLRAVSVLQLLVIMLSLTAFNLENIAIFQDLFVSVILAIVLLAISAVVQLLRSIEVNTRKRA